MASVASQYVIPTMKQKFEDPSNNSLKWGFKASAPTGIWLHRETLSNCYVLQCHGGFDPREHRLEQQVLEKHGM